MCLRSLLVSVFLLSLVSATSVGATDIQPNSSKSLSPDEVRISNSLSSTPIAFTKNMGQWPDSILFGASGGGATMWFTRDGVYYQFSRKIARAEPSAMRATVDSPEMPPDKFRRERVSIETTMIMAAFVGSSTDAQVVGLDELDYKCNYFIGKDRAAWRTDVSNVRAVVYNEIYPGIDLKYYGNGKQMEYEIVVSPGADLSQVEVRYEGARSVDVDAAGRLLVTTDWGEVIEEKPYVYQVANGRRKIVDGQFVLRGDNTFAFKLSEDYDRARALVIDPILSYSTYLGGSGDDYGARIAVDKGGNAYMTGATVSANFPTYNAYQSSHSGGYFDIFVTKFNSSGSALLYSTYIGGSREDFGWDIAVDTFGHAFITGESWSNDFPTENGYQNTYGGGPCDAYLVKLSSYGNTLLYSTYLGGSAEDYSSDLALHDNGHAYVSGSSSSTNFPVNNAYQSTYGGGAFDAFVAKFNDSGDSLRYSTYLGGAGLDWARGIDIDPAGNVYAGGYTSSANFPIRDAYQSVYGGGVNDVFVTKLNPSGDSVVYSTYIGGSLDDAGWGMAVDVDGRANVCGKTNSTDFPTTQNAYQAVYGGGTNDAFVTILNSSGSALYYSTYLGGTSDEQAWDATTDVNGNTLMAGTTSSDDFPMSNAYQPVYGGGGSDGFICKITHPGSAFIFSSYLGGSGLDLCRGIAEDNDGNVYVIGRTNSTDFPILDAYQESARGGLESFVAKFNAGTFRDTDADGVTDPMDNCPSNVNPGQEDNDHDGIGDACCCIGATGNVNAAGSETPDLSDLSLLISYLTQTLRPVLPCPTEANVNGAGGTDLSDLSLLIAYMTQAPKPTLPSCP